jgi:cytochrome c oxidase subunit 2
MELSPVFSVSALAWLQGIGGVPIVPERASSVAGRVDALHYFITAVTLIFTFLIFACIFYFAIRYRRRSEAERPKPIFGSLRLELAWTVIPLILVMTMFAWGAVLYFELMRPPANAVTLHVVGKQWMWKVQHPQGQREINELHVPVGKPVHLRMTSEDVIHSFYIPAFRVKMDVLPGRYTDLWFTPTQVGTYHLFCAEYCGTKHSGMIGWVTVMEPANFEAWLSGAPAGETLEQAGERLFKQFNCNTCHDAGPTQRGPALANLLGKRVTLQGGASVIVDENYIRESILQPNAKVVAGYQAVMPTYQGLVNEEAVLQLIAYVKSLTKEAPPGGRP